MPGLKVYEPVLREIEAHAAQSQIRQHDDPQKEHGERHQSADAEAGSLPTIAFTYSAFFISSTNAVAVSQNPISAAKYTRSRKSMTPLEIASKCVKKAQGGDRIDDALRQHAAHEVQHQRKAGEQEHESDQCRGDEGDHLVARGGGQAHADGEKSARHQEAADIGREDGAVVRAAE